MKLDSVIRAMREATYFVFAAPRGHGRRKPPSLWDEQYQKGQWKYLDSPAEIAHYMIIIGYLQHFFADAAILDVGCGHGRLLQLLQGYPYKAYLGIDHSAESLRQATGRRCSRASFEQADFETFDPRHRYDAIIFNESIYYAPLPDVTLRRYLSALTVDGIMIVSMCYNRWQAPIWKVLERSGRLMHSTVTTNENNLTWHVRVFSAKSGPRISDCDVRR
jgi:SAM-dependent methyltransferase